ncbi:MAG: nucleoside deaminase [Clostridia bacterium]|nr:nucleoside deaminase [Clostridia bacterium]MDR3645609.1 nucleoside deaminase [Clostridia bacterium]
MELERYMEIAVAEAQASLREGNNGFGAVIVKDGSVVASSYDREDTEHDPTSHAEINAIRQASRELGKKLSGCALISTHEPCPMCACAVVWSGIAEVAWGYSIKEALLQGRKRIAFPCREIFERAGADIQITEGILKSECAVLYREDVRKEIERLRHADDTALSGFNEDSAAKRARWFQENKGSFDFLSGDPVQAGYRLLLERFHITEEQAPVVKKTDREIVFHSMNFCPTLEACGILGLDTRHVCKRINEQSTDALVKQVDRRLSFSRNYDSLRPYSDSCEERICLAD